MKTMLLTFVALMLSAQTVDKYFSPELPSGAFTYNRLNGIWWQRASNYERWIYLQAVSDTLNRHVQLEGNAYDPDGWESTIPIIEAIRTENPEPPRPPAGARGQGQADDR
jgi:hypothetical protein